MLQKYKTRSIITKRDIDSMYRELPKEYDQNYETLNMNISRDIVSCNLGVFNSNEEQKKLFFRSGIKKQIENQINSLTLFYIQELKKLQREISDIQSIKVTLIILTCKVRDR